MLIIYLIILFLYCLIWGCVVQKVIENKGYDDNWFWWGFFFGLFALLVAITKPEATSTYGSSSEYPSKYNNSLFNSSLAKDSLAASGSWKCSCGRTNPKYTGTCACGMTPQKIKEKQAVVTAQKEADKKIEEQAQQRLYNLKLLKEYKELLDSGIITQEEFEKKKAEIL